MALRNDGSCVLGNGRWIAILLIDVKIYCSKHVSGRGVLRLIEQCKANATRNLCGMRRVEWSSLDRAVIERSVNLLGVRPRGFVFALALLFCQLKDARNPTTGAEPKRAERPSLLR